MARISAPPRVTSVDVARRAGVSQSTVSLVLSGKAARAHLRAHGGGGPRRGRRSSATGPNVAARALRTGVARSVALVVPDITNPFFGRVLRGAQRAAQQRRLHRRAGRHRQRPRLGGRVAAGAARRPRRRPAAVRGRAAARRDRARDRRSRCARASSRSSGSTSRPASTARSTTCSGSATAGSATSPRASTRRPSTCAASAIGARLGERRRRPCAAPFTFEGAARGRRPAARRGRLHRGLLRRRHPRRRRLPRRARRAASGSPRTSRVVGFDDLDFARVLAPPLTTVAVDAEAPRRGGLRGAGAGPGRRARRRPSRSCRSQLCVRESTAPPRLANARAEARLRVSGR